MHKGRIIEQGTHNELMQLNKEYATMVNSALLKTKNDTKEYVFYKLFLKIMIFTVSIIISNLTSRISVPTEINNRDSSTDSKRQVAPNSHCSGDNDENIAVSKEIHGGGVYQDLFISLI